MDTDAWDWEVIRKVIVAIVLLALIVTGLILLFRESTRADERKMCEENPVLRYANPCNTYDECINTCIKHLQDTEP